MDIKIIRLISGEEIVASSEVYGDKLKALKPMSVQYDPKGNPGLVPFMPWSKSQETGVETSINMSSVVSISDPIDQFKESYIQATTGISTVSTNQLIL